MGFLAGCDLAPGIEPDQRRPPGHDGGALIGILEVGQINQFGHFAENAGEDFAGLAVKFRRDENDRFVGHRIRV